MDKRIVMMLYENGWTLTKIAKRLKKTTARICQIVKECQMQETKGLCCEICGESIDEKKYFVPSERKIKPFISCQSCIDKYTF